MFPHTQPNTFTLLAVTFSAICFGIVTEAVQIPVICYPLLLVVAFLTMSFALTSVLIPSTGMSGGFVFVVFLVAMLLGVLTLVMGLDGYEQYKDGIASISDLGS